MKSTFSLKNRTDRKTKEQSLQITGDLSIKNATALWTKIKGLKSKAPVCSISLDNVVNLDVTFIQILSAYKKHREAEGATVKISAKLPDDLESIVANAGFTSLNM